MPDRVELFFLGLVAVVVAIGMWRRIKRLPRCRNCGGDLELDSIKDPTGFNLSKKVTFSFYVGPRKWTEEMKCKACGHAQPHSYWGS